MCFHTCQFPGRTDGVFGSQGGVEREQGLIQILTELDGFQSQGSKVYPNLSVYNTLERYTFPEN